MDQFAVQSIEMTTNFVGFSINHYWLILIGLMMIHTLTYIMMIWSHAAEAAPR